MSLAMADALMGIFGLRRVVEMKMICPKAKRCINRCRDVSHVPHDIPHECHDSCRFANHYCPACVPVKAKKGKTT
jgi:hypothetical protein